MISLLFAAAAQAGTPQAAPLGGAHQHTATEHSQHQHGAAQQQQGAAAKADCCKDGAKDCCKDGTGPCCQKAAGAGEHAHGHEGHDH